MIICALWMMSALALSETTRLGMFLEGKRIGSSTYQSVEASYNGKSATKSSSNTTINALLMGESVELKLETATWTDPKGSPLLMRSSLSSGGKTQRVEAKFSAKSIRVDIDNAGTKKTKTIKIPAGSKIVDDPLQIIIQGGLKVGTKRKFLVLDPTSVSLQENEVKVVGKRKTRVGETDVEATVVEIQAPQGLTTAYLSSKGDLLKVEAPMNIVMLTETDKTPTRTIIPSERPVGSDPADNDKPVDIATATRLVPDKPIEDPASLTKLTIHLTGQQLKSIPNDDHQTVTQEGKVWTIDVHPTKFAIGRSYTIAQAARKMAAWTDPALNIPSDDVKFIRLAKKITGTRLTVRAASSEIRKWVYGYMKPNATMGIVRDANDVLDSKQGVCRDYAILTVTLLRAAGIPSRLASGLVSLDGNFYYHAWVEAWDGAKWIGVDSTTDRDQISAAHIKLAEGNVDKAFSFVVLGKAKMEVVEYSRK